jgi:hypothetical protein
MQMQMQKQKQEDVDSVFGPLQYGLYSGLNSGLYRVSLGSVNDIVFSDRGRDTFEPLQLYIQKNRMDNFTYAYLPMPICLYMPICL